MTSQRLFEVADKILELAAELREATPLERRAMLEKLASHGGKARTFAEALERELMAGPERFWPAPKAKP